MYKRFLIPLLVLAFLLAACGGEAPTQAGETSAQEAPPTPEATHTQPPPTQPPPTETPALAAEEEPTPAKFVSECTMVSAPMDPETPYADIFAVTDDDWVLGPETAALTIVEYGDYQ